MKINTPEKMLAEINQTMQAYDPRHGFSVPDDQKNDCIEWAYGKDWKTIKWNYRAERFRHLHPELDHNDFSDATPILLYNKRVSEAYLESKRMKLEKLRASNLVFVGEGKVFDIYELDPNQ